MDTPLTPSETFLLDWLSKEDFSQYGECYGRTLDRLVERGLAQIHDDRALAQGDGPMYRAVSLTDAGRAAIKSRKENDHDPSRTRDL